MIYTIGYRELSQSELIQIVHGLDGVIIDCRARTSRAKSGFGRRQLTAALGKKYEWHGNSLGGMGNITHDGIVMLRNRTLAETLILLCAEESPMECHRHNGVCWPHFPDAVHIFRNELILARDLEYAESNDCDYKISGELSDLI